MVRITLVACLLCSSYFIIAQNTFYIAVDGVDDNDTYTILSSNRQKKRYAYGTQAEPYRNISTLQRGLLWNEARGYAEDGGTPRVLSPGDTILLVEGEYKNASYDAHARLMREIRIPTEDNPLPDDTLALFYNSESSILMDGIVGAPDQWITVKPAAPGTVILKASGRQAIDIKDCQWVRLEGIEIEGFVDSIPYELAYSQQFLYRWNTDVNDTRDANPVWKYEYRVPRDWTTEEIADTVFMRETPDASLARPEFFDNKGLLVRKTDHVVLDNCHVHHNGGTGVRFQDCSWMTLVNSEVNDNSRRSSGGTHGFVIDATRSDPDPLYNDSVQVRIENNLVHNNYNELYSWNGGKLFIEPHIDEGKGISLQRTYSLATDGPNADGQWRAGHLLVRNNITWFNGFSGVHCNGAERHWFVNNTSYFNSRTQRGSNTGISITSAWDSYAVNNLSVIQPRTNTSDPEDENDEEDVGFANALSMDKKSGLPGNDLVENPDGSFEDGPRNNYWHNNVFWGTIGLEVVNRSLDTLLLSADRKYKLGDNARAYMPSVDSLRQIFDHEITTTEFEIYEEQMTPAAFMLKEGSPAVDYGIPYDESTPEGMYVPTTDYFGNPRDASPDAGAVEFQQESLPVDLLAFTGKVLEKGRHQLQWTTVEETDNDFFELQRSTDGIEWHALTRVRGSGSTSEVNDYEYVDGEPKVGVNLYRLRQVDYDGSFELSHVIQLNGVGRAIGGNIYPNPFTSRFVIPITEQITRFALYSVEGRQLMDGVAYEAEENRLIVDATTLPAGAYIVRYNRHVGVVVKE